MGHRLEASKGCRTFQGCSRISRAPQLLLSPLPLLSTQPSLRLPPGSSSLLDPPVAAAGAGPAAEPAGAASHALPSCVSTLPTCYLGPEAWPARPPGHGACCSAALSRPAVDTKAWGVWLSCWYWEWLWWAGSRGAAVGVTGCKLHSTGRKDSSSCLRGPRSVGTGGRAVL